MTTFPFTAKHSSVLIAYLYLKETTLFPKGEFLRTHRVDPPGLNGFLHLGLLFGFFHPYESWPLFSGWWWWVVGRITLKNF